MQARLFRALVVCAALVSLVIDRADTVRAVSTTVVISEFRVRGPNGAADEFVELFNGSSSPVDIGGWRIAGSNNAAGVSTRATVPGGTTIGAGCFYLITNSSASGGPYSGSVPGNLTFSVGITDDGGIGLFNASNAAIDQVGMSSGSAYKEGTTLASLGASNLNRGYERKPGGAAGNGTDTDNNSADFQLISPSNPQNASSPCIGGPQPPTPPTGSGSANPPSVPAGGTTLITVNVTAGTFPASTGLAVTGDLTAIGGSGAQPFQLASGATFTVSANVAPTTAPGNKALTITVSDAQGRSSTFSLPLTVTPPPPPGAGKVIINEIDADTPGVDAAEFIELYDGGLGNTPLDGLVLVLYNGTNEATLLPTANQSYAAFDLDGYTTDANGYFILGNPGVAGAGVIFDPGPFGLLQNGPDAVALYVGSATDFPNGTIVTTANLLDAIVYGTNDPNPTNLMTLINAGQLIVNEDGNGNGTIESSQRCPNGMGGIRNSSPYLQAAPTPGAANVCPAQPPASDVVISQIYGGGGNTGSTYHHDFVELYNRGTTTVDLSGWSVQYASASGSGWDTNLQPLGGTIGAGEYYLISLAAGTGTTGPQLPLPAGANVIGQINMSGTSGKVALVDSFDPLVGNCPLTNGHLRDFIGYGSADCGEGATTAATLSNTTSAFRQGDGTIDTNVNRNDFTAASPNPRRTAPIVEIGPFVLNTDPRRGALNAPRDATIHVTFTEPVDVFDPWFDINCASTGHHTDATFAGDGKERYITPNANFQAGEQCTVTIFKDQVRDQDLDDTEPNTNMLRFNSVWSFTIATGTAPPYSPGVHLTMGNPSGAVASIGQPDNYLMEKPEFALSYNRDLGRPNWVSWHLSSEWTGTLERVDSFRPDPAVPPAWYRVQSFDFSGSGFDRGHMTPNADRDKETSIPINQATFLMSNMVAQAPDNNQGPWAAFEGYLRTLTDEGQHEIYVVAGPSGEGGIINPDSVTVTEKLADGHVSVPARTWKVVLVLPKDDGDDISRVTCSTRSIAVIMPNTQGIRNDPWENFLTNVDAVEASTGYDFFSNLPEPIQRCVEAGINGTNPPLVKGDQTITFADLGHRVFGDAPVPVSATGGASGNPVTFTASGACSAGGANGATITITSAGSCTVTASQAESALYNAAADVSRSFTIAKASPAFSLLSSPTIEAGTESTAVGGAIGINGLMVEGSVTITVGGVTVAAPIEPDGHFTATLSTAALSPANSPYQIAFSYAGGNNFNGVGANSTLTVADTTAPAITAVSASPAILTPPTHKLVDVTIGYVPSDLTGSPVCSLSVASNEEANANGDGNTALDWLVLDAHHLQVRSERAGGGSGRIYTITIRCTDSFGNSGAATTMVRVPK